MEIEARDSENSIGELADLCISCIKDEDKTPGEVFNSDFDDESKSEDVDSSEQYSEQDSGQDSEDEGQSLERKSSYSRSNVIR